MTDTPWLRVGIGRHSRAGRRRYRAANRESERGRSEACAGGTGEEKIDSAVGYAGTRGRRFAGQNRLRRANHFGRIGRAAAESAGRSDRGDVCDCEGIWRVEFLRGDPICASPCEALSFPPPTTAYKNFLFAWC